MIAGLLKGVGANAITKKSNKVDKEKLLPGTKASRDEGTFPGEKKPSAIVVRPKTTIAPKIKVSTFKSVTPKGIPGKGAATYDDLSKRLDVLAENTDILSKITGNQYNNKKEETKAEKANVEKAKRAAAEERSEERREEKSFKKGLVVPKSDFLGGILNLLKGIIFGTLVMETIRFLGDPEKSKGVFKFIEDNMVAILSTVGAAIAAVVIAPLFGPGAILLKAIGMVAAVALTLGRFALGFALTPTGRLLIAAIAARKAYYDDFLGIRSTLEGEMVKQIEKGYTTTYGERAEEGKALTKIRDNYGRIASEEVVKSMTEEEKSTAHYLRLYDEEIRKKDKADPKKLKILSEQISIQGKPLSHWIAQYYEKSEAGLPQTTVSKKLYPSQQVQPTETKVPGVTLGEKAGLSESRGRVHRGRDIAAPSGLGLKVPTDSVIQDKGYEKNYGHYVVFKDSEGLEHMYAHMKEATPYEVGNKVSAGTVIGNVGSTGKGSTGPHLHWEVSPKIGEVGYEREKIYDPIIDYNFSVNTPFTGELMVSKKPVDQAVEVAKPAPYEDTESQDVIVMDTRPPAPQMQPVPTKSGMIIQRQNTQTLLNNYYRFQVLGFLYKQG